MSSPRQGLARVEPTSSRDGRSTRTSRSATWWRAGSATRWSTGSSSRCSAGCTPATPGGSPPARPCRSWSSCADAARCSAPSSPAIDQPVFAGLPGGLARLTEALAAQVAGADRHDGARAGPDRAGFAVVVGPTTAPERIEADAVVLATPAAPTARLLTEVAPAAAAELAEIEYASMVVVTLAFRADDVRGLDDSSGFLVPPVDGRAIKASTFSFAKWGWVREAGAAHGPGAPAHLAGPARRGGHAPAHRRRAGRGLARRPGRGRRDQRGPGRHPRAAVGRRAAAVRRRPPRPGRPHPRRGRRRAGAGALRGGVRRRRDPRRHRLGPRAPSPSSRGRCSAAPRSTRRAAGASSAATRSPASRPSTTPAR